MVVKNGKSATGVKSSPSVDSARSKVGRSKRPTHQRDDNQNTLDEEHLFVVRRAVDWLRAQDDTKELDENTIYNSCEYWLVSSWSDRSFYKALEQVLMASPPGTSVKRANKDGGKAKARSKLKKKRMWVEVEDAQRQKQPAKAISLIFGRPLAKTDP